VNNKRWDLDNIISTLGAKLNVQFTSSTTNY